MRWPTAPPASAARRRPVHVGPVLDHPLAPSPASPRRAAPAELGTRPPTSAARFCHSRSGAVQLRVARSSWLDPLEVVGVDRLFELPDLLNDSTCAFSFGQLANPYCRAIWNWASVIDFAPPALKRSLAWSFRCRRSGCSGSERVAPWRLVDMATFFHRVARCPHDGLKEGSQDSGKQVGFYPFRGPDASRTLGQSYQIP